MPMTKQQAQALAHFVNLCRPDWDERGVIAQLQRLATRNPLDVALATIRATADESARTPGVIATDGPHWHERAVDPGRESNIRFPPKRAEECPRHPGQYRHACNACAVDAYNEDRGRDGDDGQPMAGLDGHALARAGVEAGKRAHAEREAAAVRQAAREGEKEDA